MLLLVSLGRLVLDVTPSDSSSHSVQMLSPRIVLGTVGTDGLGRLRPLRLEGMQGLDVDIRPPDSGLCPRSQSWKLRSTGDERRRWPGPGAQLHDERGRNPVDAKQATGEVGRMTTPDERRLRGV